MEINEPQRLELPGAFFLVPDFEFIWVIAHLFAHTMFFLSIGKRSQFQLQLGHRVIELRPSIACRCPDIWNQCEPTFNQLRWALGKGPLVGRFFAKWNSMPAIIFPPTISGGFFCRVSAASSSSWGRSFWRPSIVSMRRPSSLLRVFMFSICMTSGTASHSPPWSNQAWKLVYHECSITIFVPTRWQNLSKRQDDSLTQILWPFFAVGFSALQKVTTSINIQTSPEVQFIRR